MKKRLLLFAFVVITIICLAAITVSAETYTGACGDNLAWTLDTETGVLEIDGTGEMSDWNFGKAPWYLYRNNINSINIGDSVTSIGTYAFCNLPYITSVNIGDSVTNISSWAFAECYNLTSVDIVGNVTSIGDHAFYQCSGLTSVDICKRVRSIGAEAFAGCDSLTSVNIPDSVTKIDMGAFYYCTSLTSVTIPKTVTTIGTYAFRYCSLLTIYGYTGSSAETYASDNDIPFVALDETSVPGDADGDGKVEAIDLIFFQRVLSNWIGYTIPNSAHLDLDGDGVIKSIDAVILSRHLANWVGYETLPYVSGK